MILVTLQIGPLRLDSPVVLAPMAGVTNMAFRTLCREIEQERTGTSAALYVCEMITARALIERNPKTMHMTAFAPEENPSWPPGRTPPRRPTTPTAPGAARAPPPRWPSPTAGWTTPRTPLCPRGRT